MRPDNIQTDDTRTPMKSLKQQSGFTLIEVLIALTIFAVGLLAIAAMQTSAIRMNSTAGQMSDLSARGMDKLEMLMGLPYTDPALSLGNQSESTPPYTMNWTVAAGPVADTIVITLTVTAKGRQATLKTVRAKSL